VSVAPNDTVVTTVYANDLATDMDASRDDVSIGLVCQADTTGDVVVAIRGTQEIWEWIHDINFFLVPCPFLAAGGHTEDGFTEIYQSLRTDVAGARRLCRGTRQSCVPARRRLSDGVRAQPRRGSGDVASGRLDGERKGAIHPAGRQGARLIRATIRNAY
jgi:hypothetical protein